MSERTATGFFKHDFKYYIHSFIVVLFMFCFGYLPAPDPITPLGMHVLGIFIGLLYAWTTIDMLWPSLLGLVAIGLTEFMTVKEAFAAGFGNDTALLIFFLFIYAKYLEDAGLCKAIANWFISRKIAIGRPYMLALMLFLASYAIGATIGIFASIVLMWAIFYEICDTVGMKKGEKFPALIVVGVVYTGMLGTVVFPWRPIAAIVFNTIENYTGQGVNIFIFILISVIVSLICIAAYTLLIKFVFRPDVSLLQTETDFFGHLRHQKLTTREKGAAASLILFMLAMLLPSIFPNSDFFLITFLSQFTMTGVLASTVVILAFLQLNGKRVLNFPDCASRGMNWDSFILIAGTMPVADALGSDKCGVMAFITKITGPILSSVSPLLVMILIVLLASLLTQIAHNLVLAVVLSPILCDFSVQLGFDPIPVAILMSFALNVALATPGASGMAAMLYCNKEWSPTKLTYLYSSVSIVITMIFLVAVGIPLANLLM